MLDGVGIFASWVCPRCPRMGGSKLRMVYIVALKRIMCLVFDRVNGSATAGSRPLVMFNVLYQQVCHMSMIFSPPLSCWCRLHCWYYAPPLTLQQGPECSFMNESLGQADGDPDESRRFQENPQNSRSITENPYHMLCYVETIRNMLKLHPPIWCWNLFCFDLSLWDGMWFKMGIITVRSPIEAAIARWEPCHKWP